MYVNEREGGDWLGHSLLRSCDKNWLIKDRLLRVQAQTIERNGMGVPLYTATPDGDDFEAGKKLAQEFRSGKSAGGAIPNEAGLAVMGVTGELPDADKPIRYHDEQIAKSVLAHFVNLGQSSGTGSYALGESFLDFCVMSLQVVAQDVADVANQHVVEDVVDVNFGTEVPTFRLVFQEIGSRHQATAQAIALLVNAGVFLREPALERYLRQVYGIPNPEWTPQPQPQGDDTNGKRPGGKESRVPSGATLGSLLGLKFLELPFFFPNLAQNFALLLRRRRPPLLMQCGYDPLLSGDSPVDVQADRIGRLVRQCHGPRVDIRDFCHDLIVLHHRNCVRRRLGELMAHASKGDW
jgi:hypothetical protein